MGRMRKLPLAVLAAGLVIVATAVAGNRPQTIRLPDGWQPEGIAAHGSTLYSGSLANGAVLRVSTNGRGRKVVVPGQQGRAVAGLKVAGNKIFAAGASSERIYVFDRRTGADLFGGPIDPPG